ncbi:MAG: methyltransferase domain-containing protein [Bacteroidota bacterium]
MSYSINESNRERQGLLGNNYNRLASKYFKMLALPTAGSILDLGCGQGETTRLLNETFAPATCIGIDMDASLLKIASEKNQTLDGPDYRLANAKSLPFDDNFFDLVYARLLLIHVPGSEAVLQEMKRVCKPGGVVMVQDLAIPETSGLFPKNWAYEKMAVAMQSLFANPDMGKVLPLLFKKNEFTQITIRSDFYLLHEKGSAKQLMTQTGAAMLEKMIGKGILQKEETNDFIKELKRVEQDYSYTFLTDPFISVWGVKP